MTADLLRHEYELLRGLAIPGVPCVLDLIGGSTPCLVLVVSCAP